MAEMMKRGGGGFVFEGELSEAPRPWTNKETGEESTYLTVTYFGGTASLKLADPEQARLCKRGDWVRVTAPIKTFKENNYAGPGRITHVNEKAVA